MPVPFPSPHLLGRTVGHYRVLSPLGAGGMGQVYRGLDSVLERDVAVKVLPEDFAHNPRRVARVRREARLLASLSHPNIATLYDLVEDSGFPILIMELVPGETLARRLERGPLPVYAAAALFCQIAGGLEAAHRRGVIHRDLKPANIQITPEGTAKILDFGLAKEAPLVEVGQRSDAPTLTESADEPGRVMGTLPYMSPEQVRGRPVDRQTDIWAFGCCLFEALTGKPAFRGETPNDTLADILRADPDFSTLPPAASPALRALLGRCLQKETRQRQRDAGDVWLELGEAGNAISSPGTSPAVASAPRGRRSGVLLWVLVAAAFVVGLLVASYAPRLRNYFFSATQTPPPSQSAPGGPTGSPGSRGPVVTFQVDLSELEAALEANEPQELTNPGEVIVVVPRNPRESPPPP